jgi:two-component system sensor histidine kinase/response regulator
VVNPVKPSRLREAVAVALAAEPGTEAGAGGVPAVPEAAPAPRPARPLRVLLAEDNRVNQLVVRRLLEKRGHRITVVENGRDAVTAARGARFDVILMDVSMPEMDGIEATLAIRAGKDAAAGAVPIVALTAHAMKGDRERCLAAGMDAYLTKPLDLPALLRTVEELGARRTAPAPAPQPA